MPVVTPSMEAVSVTTANTQRQELVITRSSLDIPTNTVTVVSSRRVAVLTVEDEERFRQLASKWREETRALSSDSDIVANFAYYQIIGMGERALPLIFEEMKAHGGRWFWALRAITGENPVRSENRGNVRRMNEAWLEWARQHDYV
jgi:hypothetical protein